MHTNRLRVLHVVPTYYPAVRYGGPVYAVHGLCKALSRLGVEVRVFTTNVDGPGVLDVPVGRPVELDGVQVTYFPSPALKRLYWSPRMSLALPDAVAASDILHLHSVFLWPTSAAARVARARNVPYLLAPRGALVPELIIRKSRLIKTAWLQLIERRALAGAAGLHVTSQAEYDDASRLWLALPPPCLVPNGVDFPERIDGGSVDARLQQIAGEGAYLLYVGRINWKKGLDRLIRSLRGTGMRLLLAGNDEEGYRTTLDRLAAEQGVEAQVVFLGHVDGPDKWWLLHQARCLVLPSYNENFGNTVLEAMSVGCPVVVSQEVGAANIVRECEGGTVVDASGPALQQALASYYFDDNRRMEAGARGRAHTRAHFSWDGVAAQMIRAYRGIL